MRAPVKGTAAVLSERLLDSLRGQRGPALLITPLISLTGLLEMPMQPFNAKAMEDLAARIGKAIESGPAKDIEKNVRAVLQSGLARLDLVTREEFDTQAAVLAKTREKLERLETRVAELEARFRPPSTTH